MLFHGNLGPGEGRPPPGIAGLIARVERTRGFGDFYQHMLVAEGAGEFAFDPVMHPWDIAALQGIVQEAGGRCDTLRWRVRSPSTTLLNAHSAIAHAH